jgi:hypothetical protein
MTIHTIFADFHNSDTQGRVRLNTNGTFEDIEKLKIQLESGMKVLLDDSEGGKVLGIVEFSQEEKIWVAKIDWDSLK